MKKRTRHAIAVGVACMLAAVLAVSPQPGSGVPVAVPASAAGAYASPGTAYADEVSDAEQAVDDAQATLDGAEADLGSIAQQHSELKQEVEALQARIDETTAQAMEAQRAVIEGREAIGRIAVHEYRSGGAGSLLTLLLGAESLDELLSNMFYLNAVAEYQSDEVAAQKERQDRYDALLGELNAQKDEQDAKLAELEAKQAEAADVVASAADKLQNAQGDYAARLAALQEMSQSLAASDSGEGAAIDEGWNTNTHPSDVEGGGTVQQDPAPAPDAGSGSGSASESTGGSGSGSGSSGTSGSDAGWMTGVASAYGGSTDPYTPNPGTTATGALCDDYSMGVAVPMAWPNYRSYFGRTVEISYNGMTVLATVNDCGYMGGGSRSLDLQPGVWKAFGFSSCNAWGLRTVSYRFL